MSKKKLIVALIVGAVVIAGLAFFFSNYRDGESKGTASSTSGESSTANKDTVAGESTVESGDSFNTDDLDAGIAKEGRSTWGLAHGADETEI